MRLSLIVAMSQNGVIGRAGQLPWHLSADLKRFKRLTMGHHMVMGRKTYQSIGRPLPGRTSIVLTRDLSYRAPEVIVAHSLDDALRLAGEDGEVFVIGGAAIYRMAMPRADRMYVTHIHAAVEGDAVFPPVTWNDWKLIQDDPQIPDQNESFAYSFRIYDCQRLPAV